MPVREHLRPTVVLGLRVDRDELDRRIGRRTRRMFDAGLLEETRELLDRGLRQGRTAARAVGYAQAVRVLDGGMTVAEAVADTALRTRRLVRRQESWFGADPRVRWLDALAPDLVEVSSPWSSATMVARWHGRAPRALIMHADPLAAYAYRWFGGIARRETIDRQFDWF